VALGPPGFFQDAVVDNLFGRAVTGTSHAQPFHYYLQRFPPDLLPWLLLFPVTIWAARGALAADAAPHDRRAWRFLLAWIATSVLFFSLASGKRLRYLLTLEPAFALLFAATLRAWLPHSLQAPRVLAIAASALGVGLLGAAAALLATDRLGDAMVAYGIAIALVATVTAGTATSILLARRGAAAETRIAVLGASVFAVQILSYAFAVPALDAENSPRPIAETAAALARPGETIGLYRGHDIANAVTYYEDRPTHKIETPAELAAFFASDGRVLVFEEEQLANVESVTPVVVRGRFRVRRETWLVAVRGAPAS
jgi:4-amino-4-deoxy-L-arabinose transferase-like glycosyltransferase